MKYLKSVFVIGFIFFTTLPVFALDIPPKPNSYVNDYADLISPQTEQKLNQALGQYESATSNQIVVVTFPSLEGESLEDFSIRLVETWKPGQKENDNGVILLVFRDDRKLRIEVGYGLEGAIPDALAGQIIQNGIVPYFKLGQYEKGILAGVSAISKAAEGEYKGRGFSRGGYQYEMTEEEMRAIMMVILVIVGGLFFIDIFRFGGYARGHRTHGDRYSFWEWWFRFGLLLFVLSMLFRVLFYSMLFSRGGYSGGRGGGFSGGGGSFGGGSFGGGGASGGW